nr:HlyD family secretion protein [Acidobacteriota bacterium]
AQIDGHVHPISAKINGTVLSVAPQVEDNHPVQAGTLLVEIDPADYRAELDRALAEVARLRASADASRSQIPVATANAMGQLRVAEAGVAEARDAVATERANLEAARARVSLAEANAKRAQDDLERYSRLLDKQEISRSEYDQRLTDARTAAASLAGARADVAAAQNRISQAQSKVAVQEADLQKARTAPQQIAVAEKTSGSANADARRALAQLESARIGFANTRIVAPVSGIIGRRAVETGQRVQPGQELLNIIETGDIWVTANFKETQLEDMRPGQPAQVHVDTYARDFPGHVESIAGATGARFSLLPPENATGNFVKVVQRLPVRIRLDHGQDKDHPLRPGMSVVAKVRVR